MQKKLNKILFSSFAIILFGSAFFCYTNAALAANNLNVKMKVENIVIVGPTDNPPSISSVITNVSSNAASTTWNVSDDKEVSSASFVYGLTSGYGQSATPVGTLPTAGGSFSVSLSGLTSDTVYYYKISITDNGSHSVDSAGSFKTSVFVEPPDIIPPIITNATATPSLNSASITFNTNENATSLINYGLTTGLGSTASEGGGAIMAHQVSLLGLSPNTRYYYKIIATDVALNSAQSTVFNFKTLPDVTPPPDISNFQISSSTNSFSLTWTNPSILFTPDFAGVKILRKINSAPSGHSDVGATAIYDNSGESVVDNSVTINTAYFYTAYSYDLAGNFSPGSIVSSRINKVLVENCTNGIDDDGNGLVDCKDPACENIIPTCKAKPVENCTNGIDDDANGLVDCKDPACENSDPACIPKPKIEDCTNGIDDDGNGLIDCADPACANICKKVPTPACSDGIDNDGDSLVDFPADPGCTDAQDNDEYNPKDITVGGSQQLSFDKIRFLAGSRQIELVPQGNTVFGLANSNLSLGIRNSDFFQTPTKIILRIGDSGQHQFVYDKNNDTYYSDVLFPSSGKNQAYLEITYSSSQFDSVEINLQALGFGVLSGKNGEPVSGVVLTLYNYKSEVFAAQTYGQQNPQLSTGDGRFGWIVPNGKYYVVAKSDKFYDYSGPAINVTNNVINPSINLINIPPKLQDIIDPNANLAVNIANVAGNLAEKTNAAASRAIQQVSGAVNTVNQIASDPAVKETANTVAPTAVGIAVVSTAALVSWADIIPLLRFLFLQPLLLFRRGKREKYGTVYNSLSKLPVDLVIVRLINLETNKIVQTKVTSGNGNYFFVVNEGRYRLEARKGNFVFPTSLLADMQTDGKRLDIYHGEEIKVTDKGSVITANIPMDPAGQVAKSRFKLVWNKISRRLQSAISWVGFAVTLISLYISPTIYMWVLLGFHIAMALLFRRLSKAPITKGWGIVYDVNNKQPLSKVVARLFDAKFNKLVASEVTENDGKYYFMAGDNKYYISLEREGYEPIKTETIDLEGKEAQTIAKDVGLMKKEVK